MTSTTYDTIPSSPEHVRLGLVEHAGHLWIVRETDPDSGWTLVERTVLEAEPVAEVVVQTPPPVSPRQADAIAVGAAAVFLFLALMVGVIAHLTFADVVGCIIGFLILAWYFARPPRVHVRRKRERVTYYPV